MSFVRDIPVGRKFAFAFGLVCCFSVALGLYTFFTLRSLSTRSTSIANDDFPSIVQLASIRNSFNQVRRADLELLLCQTPACTATERGLRTKGITVYQDAMKDYQPFVDAGREREITDRISASFSQYLDASEQMRPSRGGKTGDALALLTPEATSAAFQTAADAASEDVRRAICPCL